MRLLLAGLALLLSLNPVFAQSGDGVVAGRIRAAATGQAIPGALVRVRGSLLSATADSSGRFVIQSLEPGSRTLLAAAVGFLPDSVTVQVGNARGELEFSLRPAPLELPGLMVTANRRVEELDRAEASVAILPGEAPIQRNVVTIDQALPFVSGVTFNGRDNVDIRGSTGFARGVGSRVLMLLDGHPALSADGGEVIWESLPLLDLDQVEVVKGAYSALYGSNALGGVVNLITKPVEERPVTTVRLHGGVWNTQSEYEFTDNTLNQQGVSIQHGRRIGGTGVRLALQREGSDGFTENGRSGFWAARLKLGSTSGATHPWDAYAVWSRLDEDEFFTWNDASTPYRVTPEELGDRSVYSQVLTGGTFTPVSRDQLVVRISPYLNWNENRNDFHDNTDWHRATRAGGSAQVSWLPRGSAHGITTGVDGSWTTVRSDFIGEPEITDVAGFAQDEIRFSHKLKGTIGLRADFHSATGGEAETTINPKLSVAYAAGATTNLRASLARGYRAPSAIEQFVSTRQYGFQVIPNPELRGEHAWSGEVGVTAYPWPSVRVDGAIFGSRYEDLIAPAGAPNQPFVFQFQNVSRARVLGLDVGARATVLPGKLDVEANYLFLDGKDLETGKALPYRSQHNVTGTVTALRGLAALDVRYRSRVEEVIGYPLDPRSNIFTLDVRGAYQVFGLTLLAGIRNLFNTFYTDVQERTPGAPRQWSLGVYSEF
jgi:outer membrane receptor protein involved in Fe transport